MRKTYGRERESYIWRGTVNPNTSENRSEISSDDDGEKEAKYGSTNIIKVTQPGQ